MHIFIINKITFTRNITSHLQPYNSKWFWKFLENMEFSDYFWTESGQTEKCEFWTKIFEIKCGVLIWTSNLVLKSFLYAKLSSSKQIAKPSDFCATYESFGFRQFWKIFFEDFCRFLDHQSFLLSEHARAFCGEVRGNSHNQVPINH